MKESYRLKYRIAAYISGSGSNLKAILDYSLQKKIRSEVVLVIANKDAKGLEYPASLGIETAVIPRKEMPRKEFVERHNGFINIESEIGKGTEISVFIPSENS